MTTTLEEITIEADEDDHESYLLGFAKYEARPAENLKPLSIQFAHPENAKYNGAD